MTVKDVARHDVSEQRIERALEDIWGRAFDRWHTMEYDCYADEELEAMRDDLLDHVAARTVTDPQLGTTASRTVLRTAAECSLGFLELGCYPGGDQEIFFPLIEKSISSEDKDFEAVVDHASTARDWLDTFALCLISGLVRERDRVIGLLLQEHAATILDGVPYSRLESASDPGELAEMGTRRPPRSRR